jgi:hypothetical protein
VALEPSSYHHAVIPAELHSGTTTSIHDASALDPWLRQSRRRAMARLAPASFLAESHLGARPSKLEDSLKKVWAVVVVVVVEVA